MSDQTRANRAIERSKRYRAMVPAAIQQRLPRVLPSRSASRSRNYCFTIFQKPEAPWDPEPIDWIKSSPAVQYIICGLECCPTTNKQHWQGYIELVHQNVLEGVKKSLSCSWAHLEPRKGTRDQAISYVRKLDTAVLIRLPDNSTQKVNHKHNL